jgi:hypothetical protein
MLEVRLFRCNLLIRGGTGPAHRDPDSGNTRAKRPAKKSPVIPGTLLHFFLLDKPFSWYFAFLSAWTLNL